MNLGPPGVTYLAEAHQETALERDSLGTRQPLREALMTEWRDQMVDNPVDDGAYAVGWTVSGLAVLGTIVAVWVFAI
jgi:hypothetical protein